MRLAAKERYGVVLAGTLLALFITISLPNGRYAPTGIIALQGLLLLLATATAPPRSGGQSARVATVVAVVVGLAAAFGGVPDWLVFAASASFLIATISILVRGAAALLRTEGVTVPVISAALAIYILVGLLFAAVIGAIADATTAHYFAQGTDGTPGSRVYFSFTALTTTGFGDLSPALPVGRALSVGEMLLGQIYLVTIVALLIGNVRRRPPTA